LDEILLIDDDVELCSMLTEYLGKNGFRVKAAHRGDAGMKAALQRPWSLILLDVMLPGMDGFEVLKRIRAESSVNVLLLTARGEDVDRIVGLEIGADDYIPKPFNPRELLARMRAVSRRRSTPTPGVASQALEVDGRRHEVRWMGKALPVTTIEYRLLAALVERAGDVVERDDLLKAGWPDTPDPDPLWLKSHVARLRDKLAVAGAPVPVSVRGVGYRLDLP